MYLIAQLDLASVAGLVGLLGVSSFYYFFFAAHHDRVSMYEENQLGDGCGTQPDERTRLIRSYSLPEIKEQR